MLKKTLSKHIFKHLTFQIYLKIYLNYFSPQRFCQKNKTKIKKQENSSHYVQLAVMIKNEKRQFIEGKRRKGGRKTPTYQTSATQYSMKSCFFLSQKEEG